MKKIIKLFVIVLFMFLLVGCGNDDNSIEKPILSVVDITKTSSEGLVDTYTITYSDGTKTTFTITNGETGEDGHTSTITIGANGNWFIDGIDTNVKAQGAQGEKGEDGHTPVIIIGANGNWFIDGADTNVKAQGAQGEKGEDGADGEDGHTPTITIGANGNWFIDGADTNVKAQGPQGEKGEDGADGEDGHTPVITIGANGNWFIDGADTNVKAQGAQGEKGEDGADGEDGTPGNDGVSIVSIEKTSSNGLVDTYTIYYSNDTTSKFTISNGKDGEKGRGIETLEINSNGHLIIKYSGEEEATDLGKIMNVHGHDIVEKEIVETTASCAHTGITYIVCETCGELIRTIISEKTDHVYEETITPPTCTNKGYTTHTCSECGDSYIDNYVDETGHTYGEYQADSIYHYAKMLCGCSSDIIKEEHTFVNGICSVCGYDERLNDAFGFELIEGKNEYNISSFNPGGASIIYLPKTYIGFPVTSINLISINYDNKEDITKVVFPEGYTYIGESTFLQCENLKEVELPSTLEHLGDAAFKNTNCYELYDNVNYIGKWAIKLAGTVSSIVIREGTIGLAEYTFSGSSTLKAAYLPEGLLYVNRHAFYGSNIQNIAIPDSVKIIEDGAFAECRSLSAITIGPNISAISPWLFQDCESLTDIVYKGSSSKWDSLPKGENWNIRAGSFTVHCMD